MTIKSTVARFGAIMAGAVLVAVTAGMTTSTAQAAFVQSTDAATAGFTTTTTIGFHELGVPAGTTLTNQYGGFGVTFSPMIWQDPQTCPFPHFVANCVGNFSQAASSNPFDINFSATQTQAGFHGTWNVPGTTTFNAFLGAALVDTGVVASVDVNQLNNFFGFTGVSFDRINVLVSTNLIVMDNLTFNAAAVPEPATLTLFGLGLAGLGFARRRKAA